MYLNAHFSAPCLRKWYPYANLGGLTKALKAFCGWCFPRAECCAEMLGASCLKGWHGAQNLQCIGLVQRCEMPALLRQEEPPGTSGAAVMPCGNPGRTGCTLLSWLVVLSNRLSDCRGGWSGAHQAFVSIFIPSRCTQTIVSLSLHCMLSVKATDA